jgi:hypothetical protein
MGRFTIHQAPLVVFIQLMSEYFDKEHFPCYNPGSKQWNLKPAGIPAPLVELKSVQKNSFCKYPEEEASPGRYFNDGGFFYLNS